MMIFEIEVGGRQMIKIERGVFVLLEDLDGQVQERIQTFDYRGRVAGWRPRGLAAFDFLSRKERVGLLRELRKVNGDGRVQRVGEIMFKDVPT